MDFKVGQILELFQGQEVVGSFGHCNLGFTGQWIVVSISETPAQYYGIGTKITLSQEEDINYPDKYIYVFKRGDGFIAELKDFKLKGQAKIIVEHSHNSDIK